MHRVVGLHAALHVAVTNHTEAAVAAYWLWIGVQVDSRCRRDSYCTQTHARSALRVGCCAAVAWGYEQRSTGEV